MAIVAEDQDWTTAYAHARNVVTRSNPTWIAASYAVHP